MADSSKSWQARIAEATDALGQDFVESVSYDWRLYKQDVAGSIAHATMLAKVGLITDADREAIEKGLREIEKEIDDHGHEWPGFDKQYEDIHMCVEKALIDKIGEPGRRLHTGRSRNDQVAADLYIWLNGSFAFQLPPIISEVMQKLEDLDRALHALAERSEETIMPSYTHLQRAQPISAAAEVAAWGEAFDYCISRFQRLFRTGNPLGSGAIAGTSLPLNRQETCDNLGGEMYPTLNSIYSTANRDEAIDFVFACAMASQWLSRWAEQWIIYSSAEFGFIRTADRYTTGSSMMPQKRNPDMLELIRGRCGNVYGSLVSLLVICKGLPIGYNRDLQEDKRHVFAAYDTVSSCLTMAAAIVNSTEFIADKCEAACEGGFMDATSLAEYLVVKGVPFRTAHQVVGSLVAKCEKEGKTKLSELKVEEFQEALKTHGCESVGVGEDVFDCLGARNVVARYQSAGAAGGEPLKKQLAEWKERLGL